LPGKCNDLFNTLSDRTGGAISLKSIVARSAKMAIYDGTDTEGLAGQMEYNDLFRNSPNYVPGTMAGFKVSDRFAKNPGVSAETMLGLNPLGIGILFIRPNSIVGRSASFTSAFAIHETLHALGFEDDFLKETLGIRTDRPSIEITKKFAWDCYGVDY
jgi:hypothetical protein